MLDVIGAMMAKKGLEVLASESAKAVVDSKIVPLIKGKTKFPDRETEIKNCLEEYLIMVYKKSVIMNTIVFRGTKKYLWDLYVPLTLVCCGPEQEYYLIDDDCLNKIEDLDRILIVDTAGMGKSTIVKFLIVKIIAEHKKIPILIELRKVKERISLIDYLIRQFELIGHKLESNEIIEMIKAGDFIIFFDGYDEVGNELKGHILNEIQEFITKADNNQFILTSREETDLNSLGTFKRFSIKPLTISEAFELIKLYDNSGELSEKLIERIKKDKQLSMLTEFLNNPMLTSLLYKTFQYKEEIAYKKLSFYGQVYEALFNDHDKTKGGAYVHEKMCLLDSTDFERLLRYIAFFSLQENRVEYESKSDLIEIIQKAINSMPWINTSEDNVLYDLTHSVPFFQKEGISYKWVHKSFMEYFAAGFICYESNRAEYLFQSMVNSPNIDTYMNVLDFCFEMKPEIARKEIIYPFLCEYIDHYETTYTEEGYDTYDYKFVNKMKFLSFIANFKIYLYDTSENAEKVFEEDENEKRKIFNNKDCGDVNLISYKANTRIIIASSFKQSKKICELLRIKNIDIFDSVVPSQSILERKEELDYKKNRDGVYIVTDSIMEWYNKKENFADLSDMLETACRHGVYRQIKTINYEKSVLLKEQIKKEIDKRKQIEIDLS